MDLYRVLPDYWRQSHPTCEHWSAVLNELLDSLDRGDIEIKKSSKYEVVIGRSCEIWVGNYPYAYGSPQGIVGEILPNVSTRKRLAKAVAKLNAELYSE